METLAYILMALAYEENANIYVQPMTAPRSFNWWQKSGALAILALIILGGFSKVVTAYTSSALSAVQQQADNF
jgi:hypothetical protein